jgi:polyferredoxin
MSEDAALDREDRSNACVRCGRTVRAGDADAEGWCQVCRRGLIRRATRWSVPPPLVVGLLYGWMLYWMGLLASPALVFFLALGGVLMFVTYKVSRRVFFDLLRGRATGDETS